MTTYYSATGSPTAQTRGTSPTIRSEFVLIQTGFAAVDASFTAAAAVSAAKGAIAGQVWTGNHDFTGANYVRVPTPVIASDAVTKSYADNLVFTATLPGQALGFLKSTGSVASFGATHTGYAQNEVKGADIASASTINLTTATGNFAHVTGTTTINAITIPVGALRSVVFDGALTLTHSASLLLPGAASITTAANDRMTVRGDTAGAIVTSYTRADGTPIKSGIFLLATIIPSAAVNVDFLNVFSATYDAYTIEFQGITPAVNGNGLLCRFATAGAADISASYWSLLDSDTTSSPLSSDTRLILASGVEITAPNRGVTGTLEIRNCNDAVRMKSFRFYSTFQNAAASFARNTITGGYSSPNTISGFRLYWSAGANFGTTGIVRVFGHANS